VPEPEEQEQQEAVEPEEDDWAICF
jgi:hypothetical protein